MRNAITTRSKNGPTTSTTEWPACSRGVKAKGWGGEGRDGDGRRTLYVAESGELVQPRTGKPQPPTPLDGHALDFDDPADRRVSLARWLTAPENPYFARSITNRVWANYFGVGLVEKVDDMRVSNPASNDALLTAAADYLVQQKFDLKALMRLILQVKCLSAPPAGPCLATTWTIASIRGITPNA